MRNSRYMVPVISKNWARGDRPLRHVKVSEAEEMLADGRARRIGPKKSAFWVQLKELERQEERSHASITGAEMEAAAAAAVTPRLRKPTLKQRENGEDSFYDIAATKVEEWPFIGDTLAPCVRPRAAAQV